VRLGFLVVSPFQIACKFHISHLRARFPSASPVLLLLHCGAAVASLCHTLAGCGKLPEYNTKAGQGPRRDCRSHFQQEQEIEVTLYCALNTLAGCVLEGESFFSE
jgi:hypothetical protein